MRCEQARTALSARLDGEDPPLPADAVDDHLAGCGECRDWLLRAERLTRAVRLQSVRVPDLTERILTAARRAGAVPAPPRGRWAPTRVLRFGLGLLAMLQLILAIPDLLGASGHEAHAGREVAAFDVALAVGLLIAAFYPEHARVFAPVVVTLVVCFGTISAIDVAQGTVTPGRIAIHAIAAAQAGLLWLIARGGPARPPLADPPRPVTPREGAVGQWE